MSLWIPRTAEPKYQCNVPGCDKVFYENERVQWEQHVASCARAHHDELQAAYNKARPPVLYKPFDPEYAAWAKKHQQIG